ncbi:hypothetical protein L596_030615 [Steinernema carpocapsae]|uniref:Uncharacterized protein n=1 Tax=Steinernema carpocapsae TaxID=34508 RepID=A0A4V5ZX13_STECR|nr:hypothetical protein L596_030615 [Steinernema carpocapsae]
MHIPKLLNPDMKPGAPTAQLPPVFQNESLSQPRQANSRNKRSASTLPVPLSGIRIALPTRKQRATVGS